MKNLLAAGKCHLPQATRDEQVAIRMSATPPDDFQQGGASSERTRAATATPPHFARSPQLSALSSRLPQTRLGFAARSVVGEVRIRAR